MPVVAIPPGPVITMNQGEVYALPGSACVITTAALVQRSNLYAGPFVDWSGITNGTYNHVGGFIKCVTGPTTVKAVKVKLDGTLPPGTPVDIDVAYNSAVMRSGPTNYWQLDEEGGLVANDIVGGKHGTISGGVTLNQIGAVNKGMAFNGTATGKITVTPCPPIGTGPATLECWFKSTVALSGLYPFLLDASLEGNTSFPGINIRMTNIPSISANVVKGDATAPIFSSRNMVWNDGNWHHVTAVLTRNPDIITIYVDGVPGNIGSIPSGWNLTSAQPFVMGIGVGNGGAFLANIDEVAIYNRALTPAEILAHYQARGA